MFDFEKLDVYQKAKQFNKEVYLFLRSSKTIDSVSAQEKSNWQGTTLIWFEPCTALCSPTHTYWP